MTKQSEKFTAPVYHHRKDGDHEIAMVEPDTPLHTVITGRDNRKYRLISREVDEWGPNYWAKLNEWDWNESKLNPKNWKLIGL